MPSVACAPACANLGMRVSAYPLGKPAAEVTTGLSFRCRQPPKEPRISRRKAARPPSPPPRRALAVRRRRRTLPVPQDGARLWRRASGVWCGDIMLLDIV